MEMPKLTDGHGKLQRLVGTWKGDEHMQPSQWCPDGTVAQGTSVVRSVCGGFAVVTEYVQKTGGEETFSGHGVYSYDVANGVYLLHWFDAMGMGPEIFMGNWDSGVLTMLCDGAMGRMRMISDYSIDGKLSSKMENSMDGGETWTECFHAEYTRS